MAQIDNCLNLLIVGKTGRGKSETGNTLLGGQIFKAGRITKLKINTVCDGFAKFGRYTVHVVDTPGLSTDKGGTINLEKADEMMDQALPKCGDGVDAFLCIFSFLNMFTPDDSVQALKWILGENVLKHVIVVVTGGDQFHNQMTEEGRNITFDEWCREQRGPLRKLYDHCQGRFVLFNNRERNDLKKRAQVQQIFEHIESIGSRFYYIKR